MIKQRSVCPQKTSVIIVMGVSGIGKSTIGAALAAKIGFDFEDGDDFHPNANTLKMAAGNALTDNDRWPWLKAIALEIDRKIASDKPVVIACSALKRAYRDMIALGHEEKMCFVYLHAPRDVLAKRVSDRGQHFMPASLLDSQLLVLEPPMPDEKAINIDACATIDKIVTSIIERLLA